MRAPLLLTLGLLVACSAAAQDTLQVTPYPYDGARHDRLVLRNATSAPLQVDGVGLATFDASGALAWYFVFEGVLSGKRGQTSVQCGGYSQTRCYVSYDSSLVRRPFAPQDSLVVHVGVACGLCKTATPLHFERADTLLLFLRNRASPQRIVLNDLRAVTSEADAPAQPGEVRLWPNPARGRTTLTVETTEPVTVTLYDALGHQRLRRTATPDGGRAAVRLDVSGMGPVVLVVVSSGAQRTVRRLVVLD